MAAPARGPAPSDGGDGFPDYFFRTIRESTQARLKATHVPTNTLRLRHGDYSVEVHNTTASTLVTRRAKTYTVCCLLLLA